MAEYASSLAKATMPAIRTKDLNLWYGDFQALFDVDIDVKEGKVTSLIGPSGCGKTTLVRVVMGLVSPDQGQVRFNGEVLGQKNISEIRHGIGYVVQGGALFPHMTAWSNVALMPKYLGWSFTEISRKVNSLAEIMGLPSEVLNQYPGELSGGQRQRVAIARTLLTNPKLLVMDEATSALDYETERKVCDNLFSNLNDRTVFFITHRLSTIRQADMIVMLHQGAVVEVGTHDELISQRGRYYALYRQQESS